MFSHLWTWGHRNGRDVTLIIFWWQIKERSRWFWIFAPLNDFLREEIFKMLTLAQVLHTYDRGGWDCVLWSAECLFSCVCTAVPQAPPLIYGEVRVFPICHFTLRPHLCPSRQIFMKVMTMVMVHLSRLEMYIFLCLDNWLLKESLQQSVAGQLQLMITHLLSF